MAQNTTNSMPVKSNVNFLCNCSLSHSIETAVECTSHALLNFLFLLRWSKQAVISFNLGKRGMGAVKDLHL